MEPFEFEALVIDLIFKDKECRQRIIPFLEGSLFDTYEHKEIVTYIQQFQADYNKFPSTAELKIAIKEKKVFDKLHEITTRESEYDKDFIKNEIEKNFRDKLLWNEIYKTTQGLEKGDEALKMSAADRMQTALTFNFDLSIGLDLMEEKDRVYDSLHEKDKVVPTGIKDIDRMIKGGIHEKTLTLFMGETNIGKSLIKCALATNCLLQNKNVLYITLEMAEEKVSERIIANLFDSDINTLEAIPKDRFMSKYETVLKGMKSKLMIKEYPTSTANTNKLRALLKELKMKKNFEPDVVFVDMMNIMLPNRMTKGANTNTELKTISQELRGLAMETGIPFVSSLQVNREGFGDAQIDLTNVADSIATTTVADIIFGITQTEELREARKFNFILLKNRYGLNKIKALVNVNYSRMRLSDAEEEDDVKTGGENSTSIVDKAAVDAIKAINTNKKVEKKKVIDIDMNDEDEKDIDMNDEDEKDIDMNDEDEK